MRSPLPLRPLAGKRPHGARPALLAFLGVAALLLATAAPVPGARAADEAAGWTGWSEGALDLVAALPVQSEGRVKPLYTWARVALLRSNHGTSCRFGGEPFEDRNRDGKHDADEPFTDLDGDGERDGASKDRVGHLEWLLDALFRPQFAACYLCFLVEDDAVLDDVGLRHPGKKKRDRYTYWELLPARGVLGEKARGYAQRRQRGFELTAVQTSVLELAHNVFEFEGLLDFLAFARREVAVGQLPALAEVFGDRDRVAFADVLAKVPELRRIAPLERRPGRDATDLESAAWRLQSEMRRQASLSDALALIPPAGPVGNEPYEDADGNGAWDPGEPFEDANGNGRWDEGAERWLSPWDVVRLALEGGELEGDHVALVGVLGSAAESYAHPAAFAAHLRVLQDRSRQLAEARGEYDKIPLEVRYYELDPFGKSVWLFFGAFLLVALTWLRPGWRWARWGAWALLLGATIACVAAIVIRCVLRDRPPMTGLYDTVIFITTTAVLSCLVVEWLNRRRIALACAPVLGFLGLIMAQTYELRILRQDTMPQLQAVLDTNFWLWVHVTTIAIGYCGGLVAAALGHVYVLGRAFGLKRGNEAHYDSIARMTYGMLAFSLVFSTLGTITGGIWANDSWGRFWGWDPKENGALMIVLWLLAMLHGRRGGYIANYGMAMGSILLGCVVAFSWWGVNLLNIGLHTYGYAAGIWKALKTFYLVEIAVLAVGTGWWFLRGRTAPEGA